ncbi:MAG: toxic anion resistance protein [Deltaproteobacteria bacterium]|jgi:uncharacterized protein YaaN involved in tellurite resistance|nr:toxic anion resistance protein [Deltaproteobacteria bacterium]
MALFSLTVSDADAVREEMAAPPAADAEDAARKAALEAASSDPALAEAAAKNAALVMEADPGSAEARTKIANVVERFGAESMKASADRARLLASSAGELGRADEGGGLAAKGLSRLGDAIRALDPSAVDFDSKGFLGLFRPAKSYFKRFGGSEDRIAEISRSMAQGRGSLKNDNITILLEQSKVREANKKLQREIALGLLLDDGISRLLAPAKSSGADPDRVRFVEQDVLFPLRQRILDLQQTLAVNNQALIAMEVVSRNNAELIRGVDRALTVTLAALRTSAAVAGALYNQKIALKKLGELDSAAAAAAEGASRYGLAPGGSEATVERLKESFRDVMNSFDEIDRFKSGAVKSMKDSVARFRNLAETGRAEAGALESGRG